MRDNPRLKNAVDIPDMEYTPAEMRAMADDVVTRSIAHIASLAEQPILGDVDAADLFRAMRESAPEQGTMLAPLLDDLFAKWIPRSFGTPHPGYMAYIPGRPFT